MLKTILSIFLIHAVFIINSQEKLTNKALEITDSLSKVKYIHQVAKMDNENYCDGFGSYSGEEELKMFLDAQYSNFILFKSQKDTLLVFDGKFCPGFETGVVNVYIIEDGNVSKYFSKTGTVAYIEDGFLTIHTYPCCAAILNVLSTYELKSAKPTGVNHVFFSIDDFSDVEKTRRKESLDQGIELTKAIELRWEDNIKDPFYPIPTCENNRTNKISTFGQSTTGFLVKYNEEKTWAFIKFKNQDALETFCPINFEKDFIESENYFVYGWVQTDDFVQK